MFDDRAAAGPKEGGKKISCKFLIKILRDSLIQYQKAGKTATFKYFSDLIGKNSHNSRAPLTLQSISSLQSPWR